MKVFQVQIERHLRYKEVKCNREWENGVDCKIGSTMILEGFMFFLKPILFVMILGHNWICNENTNLLNLVYVQKTNVLQC